MAGPEFEKLVLAELTRSEKSSTNYDNPRMVSSALDANEHIRASIRLQEREVAETRKSMLLKF